MKKITFSISLSLFALIGFSQKTILVNGGKFGNNTENVSVSVYDTQSQTSTTIDSIGTQSVQDILIDGNIAFVAAQDSIVKYDLNTEQRIAAVKFQGASTKTMALAPNNELIVSNWYARSSFNIYIYDYTTLSLKDSIDIKSGVTSMLVDGNTLYTTQNSSAGAPSYADTLGYIVFANISNRTVTDTMRIPNYSSNIGELVEGPSGSFLSLNDASNSIGRFFFIRMSLPSLSGTITNLNQNLKVKNQSQVVVVDDTAFVSMGQGIGSINLATSTVIDTNIVDTVITAFAYDTLNKRFYVTATDFFSYTSGKIYGRNGSYISTFSTASSPEVIRMYYDQATGIFEVNSERESIFSLYPNPAKDYITIELKDKKAINQVARIINMNAQLVKEFSLTNNLSTIDLSSLSKGVYFVTIQSEQEIYSEKLIIK